MSNKWIRIRIGLRTIKTVVSVILAMLVVDSYGATTSKLVFAMLGAMAAVQPTFIESVESCLTQIVGVLFGALAGVLLRMLPLPQLAVTAIGLVMVITLYNAFKIRFSPSLSCFMVVMICTTPDVQPMTYALGRIWDTAIGLGIGMLINTLVFPYDNSSQLRATVESIDWEVLRFLEETFDGDEVLPNVATMSHTIDAMARQLMLFSNQRLILRLRRQRRQIGIFRAVERKARLLLAHMDVLSQLERPGRLSPENRARLQAIGAQIRDDRPLDSVLERDVVTNYHVSQILSLRRELLDTLQNR